MGWCPLLGVPRRAISGRIEHTRTLTTPPHLRRQLRSLVALDRPLGTRALPLAHITLCYGQTGTVSGVAPYDGCLIDGGELPVSIAQSFNR
jgi:hypothetical protein